MSFTPTITVLVGQCGNQLGMAFLNAVATAAAATAQSQPTSSASLLSSSCAAVDATFRERVASEFFRAPTKQEERQIQQDDGHSGGDDTDDGPPALVARCVLVDMEPKVMEQTRLSMMRGGSVGAGRRQLFSVLKSQCVSREEGSANNWAFGYFTQGASKVDDLEDRLRHEVRLATESVYGSSGSSASGVGVKFHVIHSIAGGTGSGVGCLVSELIADLFPKSELHHTVVWPFQHGEVVTQSYNVILSISALRDTADSVMILSNDDIAKETRARHEGGGQPLAQGLATASSFRELNASMAKIMSALALPMQVLPLARSAAMEKRSRAVVTSSYQHQLPLHNVVTPEEQWRLSVDHTARCAMGADVRDLLDLDPVKKFFTGSTFPRNINSLESALQQHYSWQTVAQEATRFACTSRATQPLFVLRGRGAFEEGSRELMHALSVHTRRPQASPGLPVSVFGDGVFGLLAAETPLYDATVGGEYRRGDGRESSAAVFHSSPPTLRSSPTSSGGLEHALGRAQTMLQEKAYVHHYTKHGLGEDDLSNACIRCWELLEAYRDEEEEVVPMLC